MPQGFDPRVVGLDLLRFLQSCGELGYWVGAAHRGRGVAHLAVSAFIAHAFGRLGLQRLTAHSLHFNETSVRVLKSAGFQWEGTLRQYTRTASGMHDTLIFGLLKSDMRPADD